MSALRDLKAYLIKRSEDLYAESRRLHQERMQLMQPSFGPSDDQSEQEQAELCEQLTRKMARLEGQADGINEALQALDRFAIHGFNEPLATNRT